METASGERDEHWISDGQLTRELQLVDILEILADPVRLRILQILLERDHECRDLEGYVGIHVSDITEAVGLSQPSVSRHLAKLRSVGLVTLRREAQWAYYRRNESQIRRVKSMVGDI